MIIFNKEYFLDNNLKIYLLQILDKLIIMCSKHEFIFFYILYIYILFRIL